MNCDVERKQDSGTRAMTIFSYVRTPVNNTFVTKKCFLSCYRSVSTQVSEIMVLGADRLMKSMSSSSLACGSCLRSTRKKLDILASI